MRSSTVAVPLIALFAGTVSAIALAAQSGLSLCSNRLAIPVTAGAMPPMPGMDASSMAGMAGSDTLTICPVLLVLIVSSALLAAGAIVVLWRDPHRTLAQRGIARALAALPPVRTVAGTMLLGGGALATMRAVDGSGAPGLPVCATLAAMLAAGSLAAVLLSIAAARIVLALGRRLILAIAAAIACAAEAALPSTGRFLPALAGARAGALLAAGRGLRAPPPVLR